MRHFFRIMKTEQLYRIFREESTGISTDSRSLTKGRLFFALRGQNHNGNKYALQAIENGACFAVIDDPEYETEKTILVDDTLLELQALATHYRKKLNASVLAITGTNGKTTTKELISAVLSEKYKVHYTKGNLNNEIGVPLTILSAPAETGIMIVEMGANHPGEIGRLCQIACPDYGLITNVGTAHLEGFGSPEGIIKAKSELYEYLKKVNGLAIYNDNNPILKEKIFRMAVRAVQYSSPTGVEFSVEPLPSDMNLEVQVKYQRMIFKIRTNLIGTYNLENLRAAIATGLFFEVKMEDIAGAIEKYKPENNRSQARVSGSNILICDSYNANPTSMFSAITSFAGISNENKVYILGDMLELGEKSDVEHLKIIDLLKSLKADRVLLVGPIFEKASLSSGYTCFSNVNKLREYLAVNKIKESHILIKGSRGMTLEKVYDLL